MYDILDWHIFYKDLELRIIRKTSNSYNCHLFTLEIHISAQIVTYWMLMQVDNHASTLKIPYLHRISVIQIREKEKS